MGTEIERKYLVKPAEWRSHKEHLLLQFRDLGKKYRQGYIPTANETTVRLRVVGDRGYLTLKSKSQGDTRAEFEYSIPGEDAEEMLENFCLKPLIEKVRYKIEIGDLTWEVDEFMGENEGLIVAEVELKQEDQQIELPYWIERQVSDRKYFNAYLVSHPYSQWQDKS